MSEIVNSMRISKSQVIDAPPEVVWETILDEIGENFKDGSGKPMGLKIEPHVGGRWYRDLGAGVGHFWGIVQVFKPSKILEICGPMFMSYAAMNHLQYRLTPEGTGTKLDLLHTAVGLIPDQDLTNVQGGWAKIVEAIRLGAESRRAGR